MSGTYEDGVLDQLRSNVHLINLVIFTPETVLLHLLVNRMVPFYTYVT